MDGKRDKFPHNNNKTHRISVRRRPLRRRRLSRFIHTSHRQSVDRGLCHRFVILMKISRSQGQSYDKFKFAENALQKRNRRMGKMTWLRLKFHIGFRFGTGAHLYSMRHIRRFCFDCIFRFAVISLSHHLSLWCLRCALVVCLCMCLYVCGCVRVLNWRW